MSRAAPAVRPLAHRRAAPAVRPPAHRRWLAAALLALAPAAPARAVDPVPCDTQVGACWLPAPGTPWQYQLESKGRKGLASGGIDVAICQKDKKSGTCVAPGVFDIDLYVDARLTDGAFVPNTAGVDAIHAAGAHAICYVSAGDVETFRPDYQEFVDFDAACSHCLIGKPFSKVFPNEFWANLNDDQGQRTFLLAKVEARVAKCAEAGFDGVEFDVVDAYAQGADVTGWEISAETQLAYDQELSNLAHRYGMTVALKNDLGQLDALRPYFDYAVNEQCFEFDECAGYAAWIADGKAVFQVEYRTAKRRFCADALAAGFSSIKKARSFSLFAEPWKLCR